MQVNGDRVIAILIINGEIFTSDLNHQECLWEYRSKYKIDQRARETLDLPTAVDETYNLKCTHTVWGFDVFETKTNKILLGHDRETVERNFDFCKKYCKENNCELGYFKNGWEYEKYRYAGDSVIKTVTVF